MDEKTVKTKLGKYLNKKGDEVILKVLEGKPESSEGGTWISAPASIVADAMTKNDPNWKEYFDKWKSEGLITDADIA